MTKFGEFVNSKIPVLLVFQNDNNYDLGKLNLLQEQVKEKARITIIDIEKNEELSEALGIKLSPTYLIYKEGKLIRRGNENTYTTIVLNLKSII